MGNKIDLAIANKIKKHGSVLLIDKEGIRENYRLVVSEVGNSEVYWVLKNDAYGLYANEIFPIAKEVGCRSFFVATFEEGVALRSLDKDINIYILHGIIESQKQDMLRHKLIPVLNTMKQIRVWRDFAKVNSCRLTCFLHVETGINRLGLSRKDIEILVSDNEYSKDLEVGCVMGHFACADDLGGHTSVEDQYNEFNNIIKFFPNAKYSLSASYGIFLDKKYHFDLVRPAIVLYGGIKASGISPVIYLYSSILQVKELNLGEGVGYSHLWSAKRKTKIAVVPCGYADGIIRTATNKGFAYIKEHKVPIVGTISMDLMTLDITDIPESLQKEGELVELIGKNQNLNDFSANNGTIHCETLNLLTTRYPRVYI